MPESSSAWRTRKGAQQGVCATPCRVGRRLAGPVGLSRPAAPGPLPPPFEPCVRFSRTRLTDIVHRLAYAVVGRTVPLSVEAAVPILLGAAVEHALGGTDPIHTGGAAGGPSLCLGTHQS